MLVRKLYVSVPKRSNKFSMFQGFEVLVEGPSWAFLLVTDDVSSSLCAMWNRWKSKWKPDRNLYEQHCWFSRRSYKLISLFLPWSQSNSAIPGSLLEQITSASALSHSRSTLLWHPFTRPRYPRREKSASVAEQSPKMKVHRRRWTLE